MNIIVNGVANDFEYDFSMFPPNVEKIIITKDNYERLFKNLQEENIKYKEVLDKIKEYIKENACYDKDIKQCCRDLLTDECDYVLELLEEIE